MQYIDLMNLIVSTLSSTWFLTSIVKVYLKKYEQDSKIDRCYDKTKNEILRSQKHIQIISNFISITGVILTLGFIFIYYIQEGFLDSLKFCKTIISIGLHVPLLLLIYGYIIKIIFNISTNKNGIWKPSDAKTTIFIVSVFLDICLAFLDWKLCLFIGTIILGKYIWIDFVFDLDTIKKDIFVFINKIKVEDISTASYLSVRYSLQYTIIFILFEIFYIFINQFNLGFKMEVITMIVAYISVISGYHCHIGTLQRCFGIDTIERCKEALKRIKRKKEEKLKVIKWQLFCTKNNSSKKNKNKKRKRK